VIVLNVTAAMPLPGPIKKSALDDPAVIEEFNKWIGILGTFGYHTTKQELAEDVLLLSNGSRAVRKQLMRPFRPFFAFTKTHQGWGLFAYPDSHPFTMEIAARASSQEKWETLYRSQDSEHQWSGGLLHFRRVRGMYNPSAKKTPGPYNRVVTLLANRIFDEFPQHNQVRVRFLRARTWIPGEPVDNSPPKQKYMRMRTRRAP